MLLGLTSCGVQKKVMSQDIQADSYTVTDDSLSLDKAVRKIVQDALAENVTKIVTQDMEIDRQIYSQPDSSGKQYVVETQKIRAKSNAQENRSLQAERLEDYTESVDSTSVSASVEDLVVDVNTDIKEKEGLPWWQKTLMFIGAAVLLYLIIRIVLKFI